MKTFPLCVLNFQGKATVILLKNEPAIKSEIPTISPEFKAKVVAYATEVVLGGKGKGGTRGIGSAAQRYSVSQTSVARWVRMSEAKFESIKKSDLTDRFKQEVCEFALETVPSGKGKNGRRGSGAASLKYGVASTTVDRWLKKCSLRIAQQVSTFTANL